MDHPNLCTGDFDLGFPDHLADHEMFRDLPSMSKQSKKQKIWSEIAPEPAAQADADTTTVIDMRSPSSVPPCASIVEKFVAARSRRDTTKVRTILQSSLEFDGTVEYVEPIKRSSWSRRAEHNRTIGALINDLTLSLNSELNFNSEDEATSDATP
eukprot:2324591-Rhodomonas_salina.2